MSQRLSLLKRPPDVETSVPAVIHWLAIALVATKPGGHFAVNSCSRGGVKRFCLVLGGVGTPAEGYLAPAYCCCRQQPAQYSVMSETTVQGLRGNGRYSCGS